MPRARSRTNLRRWVNAIVDTVFPQICAGCGEWVRTRERALCRRCRRRIVALTEIPFCGRCGRTGSIDTLHEDGCARCRAEKHWNLSGLVRVGPYHGALKRMTLQLKYGGDLRAARELGRTLSQVLRQCSWVDELDALVPVPMHWKRRMQRPCDHSLLLAQQMGPVLRIPLLRCIRRVRYTPSQMDLAVRSQRLANVRHCFAPGSAGWSFRSYDLRGKSVCIVDNVLGSGATLCECARAARVAGAAKVYGAIICRGRVPGGPNSALDDFPGDLGLQRPGLSGAGGL